VAARFYWPYAGRQTGENMTYNFSLPGEASRAGTLSGQSEDHHRIDRDQASAMGKENWRRHPRTGEVQRERGRQGGLKAAKNRKERMI